MQNQKGEALPTRRSFLKASAGFALSISALPRTVAAATSPDITVDCSRNPYDVTPVLKAILKTENWLLSRLPQDQPLVILFGENHQRGMDGIIQQRLIDALAKDRAAKPERTLAVGCELSHNRLPEDPPVNAGDKAERIRTLETLNPGNSLPRLQLMKDCIRNDIPLAFNDAAVRQSPNGWVLDTQDAFTHSVIARASPSRVADDISVVGKEGVLLRNQAIIERAAYHMLRTSAKVYFQHCGNEHLFGSPADNIFGRSSDYKENLSYMFEQRGYPVLVVEMPYYKNRVSLSAQASAQGYDLPPIIKPVGLTMEEPRTPKAQSEMMEKAALQSGYALTMR